MSLLWSLEMEICPSATLLVLESWWEPSRGSQEDVCWHLRAAVSLGGVTFSPWHFFDSGSTVWVQGFGMQCFWVQKFGIQGFRCSHSGCSRLAAGIQMQLAGMQPSGQSSLGRGWGAQCGSRAVQKPSQELCWGRQHRSSFCPAQHPAGRSHSGSALLSPTPILWVTSVGGWAGSRGSVFLRQGRNPLQKGFEMLQLCSELELTQALRCSELTQSLLASQPLPELVAGLSLPFPSPQPTPCSQMPNQLFFISFISFISHFCSAFIRAALCSQSLWSQLCGRGEFI